MITAVATMTPSSTLRKRKPVKQQAVRLTERDDDLLELLIRYGCTTTTTLLRTIYAGRHRSGLYQQLARLAKEELIEDLTTGSSNRCRPRNVHALVVPTRDAYSHIANSPRPDGTPRAGLTYRAPSLGTLLHTLAVAEVGIRFEMMGLGVTTDRTIRSEISQWRSDCERARREKVFPPLPPADAAWITTSKPTERDGYGRSTRTHAPDLVLTAANGTLHAIEVELTSKNDRDLREVLTAFANTSKYTSVIYYTPTAAIGKKVARLATEMPSSAPRLQVREYIATHSLTI